MKKLPGKPHRTVRDTYIDFIPKRFHPSKLLKTVFVQILLETSKGFLIHGRGSMTLIVTLAVHRVSRRRNAGRRRRDEAGGGGLLQLLLAAEHAVDPVHGGPHGAVALDAEERDVHAP